MNYNFPIEDNKIRDYKIDEQTQVVKVTLEYSKIHKDKFKSCDIEDSTIYELERYDRYESIHLLVNEEGVVIRLYAIKEIGESVNLGVVKNIKETSLEEDEKEENFVPITNVFLTGEDRSTYRYRVDSTMGYSIGDLVVFDVKKRGNTESEDTLIVKEVYKHEHIGNANDLIIDDYKLGKIIFQNTDEIIDMREDSFVHKNNKYYFEDYIFVEVNVIKNVHSGEWMFKYFTIHNSDTIKNEFRKGNRLVIDELTGIIVVYNGFTK